MNKKKSNVSSIFIVIPNASIEGGYKTLEKAQELAIGLCDAEEQDYQIFEVVRSWLVAAPEEPLPQVSEDKDLNVWVDES